MSKYRKLWEYIAQSGQPELQLTFETIAQIAGAAVDHSFLTFKKELTAYGYRVGKISMKQQTIGFIREEKPNGTNLDGSV